LRDLALSELQMELPTPPLRAKAVPGRNEPCWCGSGTKYKKCHLLDDEAPTA
jgi:uncharacterized protein YecA (UPF0149 family)